MLQLSVTALFYLEDSRKIHLQGVRACRSKDMRRRGPQRVGEIERELALAPQFMFISPWTCPVYIGPARNVVYFTWGPHSGPQTFFCSIFVGFSLLCLLDTSILDSFSLFYLPNKYWSRLPSLSPENPIDHAKKLLELINEFNSFVRLKNQYLHFCCISIHL